MNQTASILVIAVLAGVFAGGAFWVSVDISAVLGAKWTARRERKRLEAEAQAMKEAAEKAREAEEEER